MARSNQTFKAKAEKGEICYICLEQPPVVLDEFGGWSCRECQNRLARVRFKHVMSTGHVLSERYKRFLDAIADDSEYAAYLEYLATPSAEEY